MMMGRRRMGKGRGHSVAWVCDLGGVDAMYRTEWKANVQIDEGRTWHAVVIFLFLGPDFPVFSLANQP